MFMDLSYPHLIQCNHPHILNGDMTHDLDTLLEEHQKCFSSSEIQHWIALGYEVHIFSLRAALHLDICDAGITFKLLHRAATVHES